MIKSNILPIIAISLFIFISGTGNGRAQIHRIGAGLAFSTGADYNHGETGNPAVFIKTWLALNKASTLHIVPSLSAYNRYRFASGVSTLTNYMFQADLDLQYAFFWEGTVRAIAFAGVNGSYLTSDYELLIPGEPGIEDRNDILPGANLGAGLELRMAPRWDFNISGKYLFARYSQFIITVQGVYYFKTRRRGYRR